MKWVQRTIELPASIDRELRMLAKVKGKSVRALIIEAVQHACPGIYVK